MVIDDLEEKVAEQSQIQSEMTVTKCPTRDNSLNALKIVSFLLNLIASMVEFLTPIIAKRHQIFRL